MIDLTLADIATIVGGQLVSPADRATVVGGSVQTDSRLSEPGSIFFALPGEETDGHLFAAAAVSLGAALVIAERPVDVDAPVILVANGVAALADLAREVVARVRQGGNLTVVAVTGSNGKTTTKNLLRAMLAAQAPTVAPNGSFNNHVGAPISMLRIDRDTRYLVVEMGASHAGEIAHLVSIAKPDIGVVLKVGLAHVGEFGGVDAIQRAKSEMVVDLPSTGTAILNADDPRVAQMAGMTAAALRWFGRSEPAEVRAEDVRSDASGTRFTLVCGARRLPVHLQILGEHHVMNALAALTVARELGLDLAEAISAIEAMPRAERWRMEVLTAPSGAVIINDAYNASPDSTRAALATLAHLGGTSARSIAVLGEMTELGESADDEHTAIGRFVAALGVEELIVVGAGARHIHTAASLARDWRGQSFFVDTAELAHELLRDELRKGDLVLVKSSKSAGLRFLGDRLAGIEPA
jgi:UDP-N-acetylmuramoyl-tripeptide--D-alanyl-D-alanine ligase